MSYTYKNITNYSINVYQKGINAKVLPDRTYTSSEPLNITGLSLISTQHSNTVDPLVEQTRLDTTYVNLTTFNPVVAQLNSNDNYDLNVNSKIDSIIADGSLIYSSSISGSILRTQKDRNLYSLTVEDFGAKGDGVTDDTSAFITSIIKSKSAILTNGKVYKISRLELIAGTNIGCYNGYATLQAYDDSVNPLISIAEESISLFNIIIDGTSVQDYYLGYPQEGSGVGVHISGAYVSDINIKNVKIKNFNNTGLNIGQVFAVTGYNKSVSMLDVECSNNRTNIKVNEYSEYITATNCIATRGRYGLVQAGGNNKYINCNFIANFINCYLINGVNNHHGGFYGCSFNHNTFSGRSLLADGVTYGCEFNGCKFWYGDIEINNSSGIRICNSQFGAIPGSTIFSITGGDINWIHNNYFYGAYTHTRNNEHSIWSNNQNSNDWNASEISPFVPNYYMRASLQNPIHLIHQDPDGPYVSLIPVEGFFHGMVNTTDIFSTGNGGIFVFPDSGLYEISVGILLTPYPSAPEQTITATIKIVNSAIIEQTRTTSAINLSPTSQGSGINFSDTIFAQAGTFAILYINSTDASYGINVNSITMLIKSV